jgi:hypothetical protein
MRSHPCTASPIASAAILIVILAAAACASPQARFHAQLAAAGLRGETVRGAGFDHLVVRKPGKASGALHVYIEGDGVPWLTPERPSDDPTPRTPLALELMLRDPREALYVGRPCYFGIGGNECSARVWTDQRYSNAVVVSMGAALGRALGGEARRPVRLIGYSGGGVLATLLAHRVPDVESVITIGANLDVAAWTALHSYTPLGGSLDPAALPPSQVPERHLVGSDDRNVPPALLRRHARNRANVEVIERPRFDHVCCWVEAWTEILAKLAP